MSIPKWINPGTMTNHWNHPTAEAWVEEHEHPVTRQKVYLAVDTSGCDEGLIGGTIYESFADACNAVGEQEGFLTLWPRQE